MTDILHLGPFAFPVDRMLAILAISAFVMLSVRLAARKGRDIGAPVSAATAAGLVVARIAYIAAHFDAYRGDWFAMIAFWQGGFLLWPGVAAAALVLVAMIRRGAGLGYALATLGAVALAFDLATAMLQPRATPLPRMPVVTQTDGTPIAIETMRGKPFVVNLWATWCPPCRRELPMLAATAAKSDVPILLVNSGEDAPRVDAFLKRLDIPADHVVLDQRSAVAQAVHAGGFPITLFIDADGNIVASHFGEISRAALEDQIARLRR
ncbi:TlpA disulfide reductase family protein [Stakelama marina]|uniref:TlpA family protein disulfide reductase n=1 Tax=Stakelama marina TaxID=2826939 RepID=A0A8T4I9L8_9SPHN|nr:TlpA disulfide reductase family protein [Stakelama marina]MBR0551043.1 TlpA family protein disulfide reductase [Stakelama marina]